MQLRLIYPLAAVTLLVALQAGLNAQDPTPVAYVFA